MAVIIPVVSKFDDKGLKQAQSSFGKLGSSLKGILGAAGIGVGLSSIVAGLKQSTVAAIEDTKSQALLANQLRNTIGASDAQISSVEASIAAMQKQAAVADDQIRPAFASLVRATGDVARATSLTSLALDVAAGTGKDLGAVSLALGKAVNGSTTSLLKLVPSIKGASDPMGELAKQFDGAAVAAAKNDPIQRLNILFGEMQEQIGTALLPSLEKFADWMSGPSGTQLINGLVDSFEKMATKASLAGDGVAYLGKQLTQNFEGAELPNGINKAAENISLIGTNAIAAFTPVTGLLKILQLIGAASNVVDAAQFDPTRSGDPSAGRYAAMEAFAKSGALTKTPTPTKGTPTKQATDYVKEFATSLADEARKQMARIRLQNKGLSEGLIESIIGSGKGWYQVAQNTLNLSAPALTSLKKAWASTGAGIAEAAEAAAKAAEKAAEETAAAAEAAAAVIQKAKDDLAEINAALNPAARSVVEVYNDAKNAYESLKTSSDAFAKSIPDLVAGVKNMTDLAEPIGQFESQVVASFGNIESSLKNALDTKLITDKAYADLSSWAKREMSLMQDIAKQRDALANRISLAESVYNDAKNSIMAYGNINSALKSTSQTITETQTKIVDGISLTLTKSVEQISSVSLVDQYKSILAKTKEFAANLNTLRKMGLNKDLFKQIVDAGVEAGGATATALIAGGQQSVAELNGVFTELQAVGDQVGESTAVVMYNNGIDVMGGFINGMKAQADALAATAKTLADTFAAAFADKLKSALKEAIDEANKVLIAALAELLKAKAAAEAVLAPAVDYSKLPKPVVAPVPVIPTNSVVTGGSTGGGAIIGGSTFYVNVTSNDPNAVVDALRVYQKRNGSAVLI